MYFITGAVVHKPAIYNFPDLFLPSDDDLCGNNNIHEHEFALWEWISIMGGNFYYGREFPLWEGISIMGINFYYVPQLYKKFLSPII